MPKSKRAKVVSLTQTKKKDREWKSSLIERVRDALSERSSVYVFKYENMRNGTFKEMRAATEATTTFFGNSKPVLPAAATTKIPESNASWTARLVCELEDENASFGEPPKLREIMSTFCVILHHLIA